MTENHHPDTRIEAHRLRRTMGSGLIMDSFGESRYAFIQLPSLDIHLMHDARSQMDGRSGEHTKVCGPWNMVGHLQPLTMFSPLLCLRLIAASEI